MNTTFDNQFLQLPFYKDHPYMLPFVGDDYISPKHKKLLLIGDSHYMPPDSSIHHSASLWYGGSPTLSQDEHDHCNTRDTWKGGKSPFHKHIRSSLNSISNYVDVWDHVAFYNYFLRPADNPCTEDAEGSSSYEKFWKSHGGEQEDREHAIKNLLNVITILKPELVVFLSKLTIICAEGLWDENGIKDPDFQGDYRTYCANITEDFWQWTKDEKRGNVKDYIYLNHPSSAHWNKPMPKSYKKAKGRIAKQFFEEHLKSEWIL